MAAKGISTGIERLVSQKKEAEKASVQISKQWKEVRNRIDTVLMSNNVMKSTELRQRCLLLDHLHTEGRVEHIKENWGPLYLERVQPLLQQLANLEDQLAKHV